LIFLFCIHMTILCIYLGKSLRELEIDCCWSIDRLETLTLGFDRYTRYLAFYREDVEPPPLEQTNNNSWCRSRIEDMELRILEVGDHIMKEFGKLENLFDSCSKIRGTYHLYNKNRLNL